MISIIIPVYNAEKYLDKCLLSVLGVNDAEIIAVNDCSTDNTGEILSKYKDKIVLLENKENMGAGGSRNRGLIAAKGEYIGFLDNDDWVDPYYFENMLKEIQKQNADICVALKIANHKGNIKKEHFLKSKDLKQAVFVDKTAPWAKIYRREFLLKNKILFDKGRGEDIYPAFLCAFYANKIAACPTLNNSRINPNDKSLYHCRIRPESVSHRKICEKDLSELLVYEKIFKFLEINTVEPAQYAYWRRLVQKRGAISFDFLYRAAPNDLKAEILSRYEKIFGEKITFSKYLIWKIKRKFEKFNTLTKF